MSVSPRRSRRIAGLPALSAESDSDSDRFEVPQPYAFSEWMNQDSYPNGEVRQPTPCTTLAAVAATGLAYVSFVLAASRFFGGSPACATC